MHRTASPKRAINEVRSGRVLAFTKDSRIRLLGVTSLKRSKYLPELPSMAESGLPGTAVTPVAKATRINAAMAKLLKDPVILERLDKQGIEPRALSNPDFGKLLAADYVRMAAVVKASGAKID